MNLSDVRRSGPLARGTAWFVVGNLGARSLGLVTTLLVAVWAAPAEVGQYGIFALSATALAAVAVLGMPPLVTKRLGSGTSGESDVLITAAWVGTGTMCVLTACAILLAEPATSAARLPNEFPVRTVGVVMVWAGAQAANQLFIAALTGWKLFRVATMCSLARSISLAVGSIAGAALEPSAASIATGAAFGELAGAVLAGHACRRRLSHVNLRPSWASLRWVVTYGLPAGAASIGVQAALWFSQNRLAHSDSSLVGVAVLLLMSRLLLIVTLVPSSLSAAALPLIAGDAPGSSQKILIRRALRSTVGTAIPFAAVVALAAVVLLPVLRPDYGSHVNLMLFMAAGGIFVALNSTLGAVAVALGELRSWIISDWVLAGVMAVGAALFVTTMGSSALGVVYACSYGASCAFLWGSIRRKVAA